MSKVTFDDDEFEYELLLRHMDEELRESLHKSRNWPSDQDFLDAYAEAHMERFGERFQIGK